MRLRLPNQLLVVAGLTTILNLSCKREIPVVYSLQVIQGYRIEGSVSDVLGRPLSDVEIRVFFEYGFVGNNPVPSRSYTLQSPNEFVEVRVYDSVGRAVRTLFAGVVTDTSIQVIWDKQMPDSSAAPCGMYTVKYLVGGDERASYVVIVDGTVSARSNVSGRFVIPQENLPLGVSPVPLFTSTNSFLGNYLIGERVELQFRAGNTSQNFVVVVRKDQLTSLHIVLR